MQIDEKIITQQEVNEMQKAIETATTEEDPFKSPEALETLAHVRERMLQQQEAQHSQMKTKEERIAKELTMTITSLQKFMAPEDVAANAYDFAMIAYCQLWNLSTDPISTRIRLKAAQVLEQVYYEIGKQESREGMLMLLQAEVDKHHALWTRIQELCQLPDGRYGTYRTNWDKFFLDTGGFTINSLASYNLLDKVELTLEEAGTYLITIKDTANAAR